MPGHNHYSWCICGWCYKYKSTSALKWRGYYLHDESYALRKLKDSGAESSRSAYFVNPNASCPQCRTKVFYYQNAYGSRVYFDELGPPWPKHKCTDRVGQSSKRYEPIRMRTLGEMKDLLEAAVVAGANPNEMFEKRYGRLPADLLVVVETFRLGFKNFVKAESISPRLQHPVLISFSSAKIVPRVDDYFSFSDDSVSFLDGETLSPRECQAKVISESEWVANVANRR